MYSTHGEGHEGQNNIYKVSLTLLNVNKKENI